MLGGIAVATTIIYKTYVLWRRTITILALYVSVIVFDCPEHVGCIGMIIAFIV